MAIRQEFYRENRVRFVMDLGVANTGLSPVVIVRRASDGLFWNGTTAFAAPVVTVALPEPDAANTPGYYEIALPVAAVDVLLGRDGYIATFTEATLPAAERAMIAVYDTNAVLDGVWTEALGDHSGVAGSTAAAVRRMLGLRQHNTKTVNSTFNAQGLPETGTLYIYPDKATLVADSGNTGAGANGRYDFAATYNPTTGALLTFASTLEL